MLVDVVGLDVDVFEVFDEFLYDLFVVVDVVLEYCLVVYDYVVCE